MSFRTLICWTLNWKEFLFSYSFIISIVIILLKTFSLPRHSFSVTVLLEWCRSRHWWRGKRSALEKMTGPGERKKIQEERKTLWKWLRHLLSLKANLKKIKNAKEKRKLLQLFRPVLPSSHPQMCETVKTRKSKICPIEKFLHTIVWWIRTPELRTEKTNHAIDASPIQQNSED